MSPISNYPPAEATRLHSRHPRYEETRPDVLIAATKTLAKPDAGNVIAWI